MLDFQQEQRDILFHRRWMRSYMVISASTAWCTNSLNQLVTRAALQSVFGDLRETGYLVFSKIPVIYVSPRLVVTAEALQEQLFLPRSSVRLCKCTLGFVRF